MTLVPMAHGAYKLASTVDGRPYRVADIAPVGVITGKSAHQFRGAVNRWLAGEIDAGSVTNPGHVHVHVHGAGAVKFRDGWGRFGGTVESLHRPVIGECFTTSSVEWVSMLGFDGTGDSPFRVNLQCGEPESGAEQNSGIEVIDWLQDFLRCSRQQVFQVARLSSATYYAWKSNANLMARPSTIADALKLRASLQLAVNARGESEVRTLLRSGERSILDKLCGSVTDWHDGIASLAALSELRRESAADSVASVDDYMARLAELQRQAQSAVTAGAPGATKMSDDEQRQAEGWGW